MDRILNIAKALLLVLLAVMVVFLVKGTARHVDFGELTAQVTEQADVSGMKQGDEKLLRRLYGLNGGDFENWVLYVSEDNMDVAELLLVEVKSTEQLAAVEEAVEKRAETQHENFEGYAPEQVQMIENRALKMSGSYLLFHIGEEPQEVQKEFMECLYR